MSKQNFEANDRTDPLRLPKNREEFEVQRSDSARSEVGVTGSSFPGEEATVAITTKKKGWHHMDVEYAKLVRKMLDESIKAAQKHNRKLGLK